MLEVQSRQMLLLSGTFVFIPTLSERGTYFQSQTIS